MIVSGWPTSHVAHASHADTHRLRRFTQGVSETLRSRLILLTSGAQGAQFVLDGTLNAFLPLFGRDVLGLQVTHLGWLFGIQTVTTLATRPVMGMLSDRLGRQPPAHS